MWSLFLQLVKSVNLKHKNVNIDNWVFRLNYRFTFWGLLVVAASLWTTDIFGKRIECTHSRMEDKTKTNEALDHVINKYCYYIGAFIIPRHHYKNATNSEIKYPGVGPIIGAEPIVKLTWYQWVQLSLLLQACCFYIPHMLWRVKENKTISLFVGGLTMLDLLEDEKKAEIFTDVKMNMYGKLKYYSWWAPWLIFFEVLNLVNVIIQWYITDWFLGGNFANLGAALPGLYDLDPNGFNPLEVAFPKIAKCTYYKFGPTGDMQNVDLLCVMAYNFVFEKLYLVLWFWYIFLITTTTITLIHRLFSRLFFKSKVQYNIALYRSRTTFKADPRDISLIVEECSYYEWLFLEYITENLDELAVELFASIADDIRGTPRRPETLRISELCSEKSRSPYLSSRDETSEEGFNI